MVLLIKPDLFHYRVLIGVGGTLLAASSILHDFCDSKTRHRSKEERWLVLQVKQELWYGSKSFKSLFSLVQEGVTEVFACAHLQGHPLDRVDAGPANLNG